MENDKPIKCQFGQHINNMDKEKLVDLCLKVSKDEPLEILYDMEAEDLIRKYQSAWMDGLDNLQ